MVSEEPGAPTGEIAVEHAPEHGRFRLTVDGQDAVILRYRERPARVSASGSSLESEAVPATWDIVSTHADHKFRGTGLASVLVQQVFELARAQRRKIVPTCPYIPVWVRRHPADADLIEGPE